MNITEASLLIEIEQLGDKSWMVDAPWLDEALHGPDWEDLYRIAISQRPKLRK